MLHEPDQPAPDAPTSRLTRTLTRYEAVFIAVTLIVAITRLSGGGFRGDRAEEAAAGTVPAVSAPASEFDNTASITNPALPGGDLNVALGIAPSIDEPTPPTPPPAAPASPPPPSGGGDDSGGGSGGGPLTCTADEGLPMPFFSMIVAALQQAEGTVSSTAGQALPASVADTIAGQAGCTGGAAAKAAMATAVAFPSLGFILSALAL